MISKLYSEMSPLERIKDYNSKKWYGRLLSYLLKRIPCYKGEQLNKGDLKMSFNPNAEHSCKECGFEFDKETPQSNNNPFLCVECDREENPEIADKTNASEKSQS